MPIAAELKTAGTKPNVSERLRRNNTPAAGKTHSGVKWHGSDLLRPQTRNMEFNQQSWTTTHKPTGDTQPCLSTRVFVHGVDTHGHGAQSWHKAPEVSERPAIRRNALRCELGATGTWQLTN